MPTQTVDLKETSYSAIAVTSKLFGGIYTTFTRLDNFRDEAKPYTLGLYRWPGGSLAEGKLDDNRTTNYDLSNPDIYKKLVQNANGLWEWSTRDRGLSDVLDAAREDGRDFSMILPTQSYFNSASTSSADAILADYRLDILTFLNRLTTTETSQYYSAASNFFASGHRMILEVGNETAHLGWSKGDYSYHWNYGRLAYTALTATRLFDNNHAGALDQVDVAVQMGVNHGGAQKIINELNGSRSDGSTQRTNVLGEIDRFVSHAGIVKAASDFNFADEKRIIKEWNDATVGHNIVSEGRLFASAWGVGETDSIFKDDWQKNQNVEGYHDIIDLYKAQHLEDSKNLADVDAGARQAGATIDVFSKLTALGFAETSIWGTVDGMTNSSAYHQFDFDNKWDFNNPNVMSQLSHGGEVLRQAAESLRGTRLITDGLVDGSNWTAKYERKHGAAQVNNYAYTDNAKYVIFGTVTDIDGRAETHTGSLTVTYDLSDYGDVRYVWAEKVTTRFDQAEWEAFQERFWQERPNADVAELNTYRRLFETPVLTREYLPLSSDKSEFTFTYTHDFETVRFIAARTNPGAGYLHLWGSKNADTLKGGASSDLLEGNNGNDNIAGGFGNDTIIGGFGNDTLNGGHGADELIGGSAIDEASYAGAPAGVLADLQLAQLNTLYASGDTYVGIENLRGSLYGDELRGDAQNNKIWGEAGHDTLYGRDGNDTIIGGYGNDTLNGGHGADELIGGSAIDEASYAGAPAGVLADLQFAQVNTFYASGDTYVEIENLRGSSFEDDLRGNARRNTIWGGAGHDTLYGRNGNDTILGGDGNDIVLGGSGADHLDGGIGRDAVSYADATEQVRADLKWASQNTGYAYGDVYVDIEDLRGSVLSDDLRGDAQNNKIWGDAGSDTLYGRDGNDTIFGGDGNDIVLGGSGADHLDGGIGRDAVSYADATGQVRADLKWASQNTGYAYGDVYVSIEDLFGSVHGDDLRGSDAANMLRGDAGNDVVQGRDGDDTIDGGTGNDRLIGGAGTDSINGGAGSDRLEGGDGNDHLDAGLGGFGDLRAATSQFTVSTGWDMTRFEIRMADVNADGRADIIGFGGYSVFVALGQGDGTFTPQKVGSNQFTEANGGWTAKLHERDVADVNGDGYADLIGFGGNSVFVALGNGDGTFRSKQFASPGFSVEGGWKVAVHERELADVNGDGRADIVGFGDASVFVALGQTDGTFAQATSAGQMFTKLNGGWTALQHEREVADVNGDGHVDLIGFGKSAVYVAFGDGLGRFSGAVRASDHFALNDGWSQLRDERHVTQTADINGDGRADIVGFGQDKLLVAYGQTDGKFSNPISMGTKFTTNAGSWTAETYIREIADLNGDGLVDLIGFGQDATRVALNTGDVLSGGQGQDTLIGSYSADRISGGLGNDTLTGGGGRDIFVFSTGCGKDVVTDFEAGANHDRLDFSGVEAVAGYDDLKAHAQDFPEGDGRPAGVVISYGPEDQVTLNGIHLSQLTEDHFIFG